MSSVPPDQSFSMLTRDDLVRLEKQRGYVQLVATQIGVALRLDGSKTDLGALQRIVDSGRIGREQTWELQSLGVVFGDVFARETELRWVVVEDEYGRDPALRFRETKNLVFPLTLISKRVEEARSVEVEVIFDGVLEHIERFR